MKKRPISEFKNFHVAAAWALGAYAKAHPKEMKAMKPADAIYICTGAVSGLTAAQWRAPASKLLKGAKNVARGVLARQTMVANGGGKVGAQTRIAKSPKPSPDVHQGVLDHADEYVSMVSMFRTVRDKFCGNPEMARAGLELVRPFFEPSKPQLMHLEASAEAAAQAE